METVIERIARLGLRDIKDFSEKRSASQRS